jgi:nitroreductase
MITNKVVECLLDHRSIRKYTDQDPSDEVIETVVRAGQQAPFGGQSYSVLLSRNRDKNPWRAPLLFTICVDSYKFELIMEERGWKRRTNDLNHLFMAKQDASLMNENMVIAGRSLGLGSCLLGAAPMKADKIAKEYNLPPLVFPLVQMTMGYPAEDPPPRPRFPLNFTLFEDEYPRFTHDEVLEAMKVMDEGYLAQDYYRKSGAMIPLVVDREETYTFDDYSWTEHLCRKAGQWNPDPAPLLEQLRKRGYHILKKND